MNTNEESRGKLCDRIHICQSSLQRNELFQLDLSNKVYRYQIPSTNDWEDWVHEFGYPDSAFIHKISPFKNCGVPPKLALKSLRLRCSSIYPAEFVLHCGRLGCANAFKSCHVNCHRWLKSYVGDFCLEIVYCKGNPPFYFFLKNHFY